MNIDLIKEASSISIPGGIEMEKGIIPLQLNSKQRIQRLSFNFENGLKIDKNYSFVFGLKVISKDYIYPDIINGDIGFPEIQIENREGIIYRFKRGNLKDFMSLFFDDSIQEIRIPYSSFIYNIDIKSNAKNNENFFETPIIKICFDFLSHPSEFLSLEIHTPKFEPELVFDDVFDYLNIEKINKSKNIPIFLTEGKTISLGITKKSFAKNLLKGNSILQWQAKSYTSKKNLSGSALIGNSKIFLELPALAYGETSIDFTLIHEERVLAKSSIALSKVYRGVPGEKSSIGFSDECFFETASILGCSKKRLVINLTTIMKTENGFSFRSDNDPFKILAGNNKQFIVAFKGMPRWLSSKPDAHDFHRYGPLLLSEYENLVKWLLKLLESHEIYALETWNEANVIHEWNDSIENLLSIQRIIYETAKNLRAKIKILSPSSTSWDFNYFSKLSASGILSYCDGFAIHGYTYQPYAHNVLFDKISNFIEPFRRVNPDFKVIITEIGFRYPAFNHYEQALFFTLFSIQTHFRESIESIFWFRIKNSRPESSSNYDQNASCGYAGFSFNETYARPFVASFSFLNFILYDLTPQTFSASNEDTFFYGLSNRFGETEIVFSTDLVNKSASLNWSIKFVYDIFGNKVEKNDLSKHSLIFILSKEIFI